MTVPESPACKKVGTFHQDHSHHEDPDPESATNKARTEGNRTQYWRRAIRMRLLKTVVVLFSVKVPEINDDFSSADQTSLSFDKYPRKETN